MKNGERKVEDVKFFKGHAKKPLSDAEVEMKFRRLTADFLEPDNSDDLLRRLWRLDEIGDVRTVLERIEVKASRKTT
jgi:2-methylcitrate dehydratase